MNEAIDGRLTGRSSEGGRDGGAWRTAREAPEKKFI
jgi:hypothetical protein